MESILRDLRSDSNCLHPNHLEFILTRHTVRTVPVLVNVLPACTWRNALLWPSLLFVVNQSAHDAHPGLVFHVFIHRCQIGLLEITPYSTATEIHLLGDASAVFLTDILRETIIHENGKFNSTHRCTLSHLRRAGLQWPIRRPVSEIVT